MDVTELDQRDSIPAQFAYFKNWRRYDKFCIKSGNESPFIFIRYSKTNSDRVLVHRIFLKEDHSLYNNLGRREVWSPSPLPRYVGKLK